MTGGSPTTAARPLSAPRGFRVLRLVGFPAWRRWCFPCCWVPSFSTGCIATSTSLRPPSCCATASVGIGWPFRSFSACGAMWSVPCAGVRRWSRWVVVRARPIWSMPSTCPMPRASSSLAWAKCRVAASFRATTVCLSPSRWARSSPSAWSTPFASCSLRVSPSCSSFPSSSPSSARRAPRFPRLSTSSAPPGSTSPCSAW